MDQDPKQIIPDPGKCSGSNQFRIYNTGTRAQLQWAGQIPVYKYKNLYSTGIYNKNQYFVPSNLLKKACKMLFLYPDKEEF